MAAGPVREGGVDGRAVLAREARGFAGDKRGPPLGDVPDLQREERLRHLADEGASEAEMTAAVRGAVASGQRNLRGDPAADPALRKTCPALGIALRPVERLGEPGLRCCSGRLEPLELAEGVDDLAVVEGRTRVDAGMSEVLHPLGDRVVERRTPFAHTFEYSPMIRRGQGLGPLSLAACAGLVR